MSETIKRFSRDYDGNLRLHPSGLLVLHVDHVEALATERAAREAAERERDEWAAAAREGVNVTAMGMEEVQRLRAQLSALRSRCEGLAAKWRAENGDYPESKRDCADELREMLAPSIPESEGNSP